MNTGQVKRMANKGDTERLIRRLFSCDIFGREAAAEALGESNDPRALVPLMKAAFNDRDFRVRGAAAISCKKLINKNAVEALIGALGDENFTVRKEAAKYLGELKDPRAVEPLIKALQDKDTAIREVAAKSLYEFKLESPDSAEQFLIALSDKNPVAREIAANVLGDMKEPRAVEPLIKMLEADKIPNVRLAAAKALREIKDPCTVEAFISAIPDVHLREVAIEALGELEDPRAVKALVTALSFGGLNLRKKAAEGLLRIARKNPGLGILDHSIIKTIEKFHADGFKSEHHDYQPGSWDDGFGPHTDMGPKGAIHTDNGGIGINIVEWRRTNDKN